MEGLGLSHETEELGMCLDKRRGNSFVTCDLVAGGTGVCCIEARQAAALIDMNQVLVRAIERKQRLRFLYNGRTRLVEPQCYGIGTRGTELLRAHQVQGGQEREPLFDVSKIAKLEVLNEVFDRPGPNYKKDDSAMKTIFSQL